MLSALMLFTLATSATSFDAVATLASPPRLSPEIVAELKDFLHLIPAATVDELVAKHYIVDGNFRKAAEFLRSTQFTQLLQSVQRIPEVVAILEFLHLQTKDGPLDLAENLQAGEQSGQSGTPLMDWQRRLAHVTTNLPLQIELLSDADDPAALHSFTTFAEELAEHLPRGDYVEMIKEKRRRSAAFAEFYAALKSPQFVVMVETALKSSSLSTTLQCLSSSDIDVDSLKPILFKVLSWGPSVNSS